MIPAIFMHIQKTAGTTIASLARKHYGPENIMTHGDHLCGYFDAVNPSQFFRKDDILARYREKLFISGHFGYSFCSAFMADRYSFTFLRDPKERILSCYYFFRTQNAEEFPIYKIAKSNSLENFLELGLEQYNVRGYIWNAQAWQLAHGYCNCDGKGLPQFSETEIQDLAYKHINSFSFVGTVENFLRGRDKVFKALGIPLPIVNRKLNATAKRPAVKELPKSTQYLLHKLTELEQPLYECVASSQAD